MLFYTGWRPAWRRGPCPCHGRPRFNPAPSVPRLHALPGQDAQLFPVQFPQSAVLFE
jgi:hypothetical protein